MANRALGRTAFADAGEDIHVPQPGPGGLDSFANDGDSDYRGYMTDISSTEDEAFIKNATISQDGTFTRAAQYRRLLSEMGQQINQECRTTCVSQSTAMR